MVETANPIATHWTTVWANFIKAHERLLIICISAFLLFKAGQGIENIVLRHDEKISNQAAVKVTVDTTTNKTLTDELAAAKSDQAVQDAKINASVNAALAQLKAQQQQDSQATQQQILDRWKLLLPMKPGAIVSSGVDDTITSEAANQTVQALEQIPVLQNEVSSLNAKLLTDDGIIVKQDDLIIGLNKQIVDEKASHIADVNLEKAKARHSFWKGMKIGVVIGAVGGELIRVWAGHP